MGETPKPPTNLFGIFQMAIFLASTKPISRAKGQSAVACASYRAGVELEDKRYGKTHDYSKRYGVMSADIILPSSLKDKGINIDRGELWNLAEETETRKNSRVAREWLINLPYELDEETRKQLAHDFAQSLADKFGTIADCAIHKPTDKEIERGADARNFHAHIMFTTRKAELTDDGKIKFTDKADCELADTDRKKKGLSKAKAEVTEIRQLWETLANEKLAEHNHQLIDSRSYKSQGIDIEPQLKMGAVATKLERNKYAEELKKAEKAKTEGEHYEIDKTPVTELGKINEIINERNELVFNLELKDNKLINERADQIIFESRKKQDIEHTTPPPTKAIGGGVVQSNAVAKALALASNVKNKREQEKLEEAKARAEEAKKLQQQREAEQAKQKAIEQEKLEQARAEAEQRKQAEAEQRQLEVNQFKEHKQEIYAQARANPDNLTGESKAVIAIKIASEAVQGLNSYIDDPSTTTTQRKYAVHERDGLAELTAVQAQKGLTATKQLYSRSERRTHTAELQGALDDFADVTSGNVGKDAQQEIQDAQQAIKDYSNEINRSRSYGMGR